MTLPGPKPKSLKERFWKKVNKTEHCWVWTGCLGKDGYGRISTLNIPELAHRASWRLINGEIPKNLWVLHHCDNPSCVRPDHLFLGSHLDNMMDMVKKGRQAKGDRNSSVKHPEKLPRGETHHFAKLNSKQIISIRKRFFHGEKQSRLSEEFNVSQSQISNIVIRKHWAHVN